MVFIQTHYLSIYLIYHLGLCNLTQDFFRSHLKPIVIHYQFPFFLRHCCIRSRNKIYMISSFFKFLSFFQANTIRNFGEFDMNNFHFETNLTPSTTNNTTQQTEMENFFFRLLLLFFDTILIMVLATNQTFRNMYKQFRVGI